MIVRPICPPNIQKECGKPRRAPMADCYSKAQVANFVKSAENRAVELYTLREFGCPAGRRRPALQEARRFALRLPVADKESKRNAKARVADYRLYKKAAKGKLTEGIFLCLAFKMDAGKILSPNYKGLPIVLRNEVRRKGRVEVFCSRVGSIGGQTESILRRFSSRHCGLVRTMPYSP